MGGEARGGERMEKQQKEMQLVLGKNPALDRCFTKLQVNPRRFCVKG